MLQIFFCLLMFSSLTYAQSVQPGLWQTDTKVEINGISLPASQEKECVSASDAKDIKKAITKELEKEGCASTKWTAKGKQIEISLKCEKSGLDAEGKLRGSISAKNYDLKGDAEGSYKNIPSQANISLKGKWLKTCE